MNIKLITVIAFLLATNCYAQDSDCLYTYKAHVTNIYDADTITVDIDLGFNMWIHGERVRLARIDAPEVRGTGKERGLVSRDSLSSLILNKDVTIRTMRDKKGKYGRYIVEIYFDGMNINDWLVDNGLALYKSY